MGWLSNFLSRGSKQATITFRCNICGKPSSSPLSKLTREEVTCRCGSTVRLRGLAYVLAQEIFGRPIAIPDFPHQPDIVGIDMSGADTYAKCLQKKLGYTNTFLHKKPRLDITTPQSQWVGKCDFVISSDVFEHVAQPVSRAFENTLQLLKPGGVFVFTVPYAKTGDTMEHFPELHDFHLERSGKQQYLINKTIDGRIQEFKELIFHGGEGETLEMRVFSETGIFSELINAGFTNIRIHDGPCLEFGIIWHHAWSLPISANRPRH